MIGLGLGDHKDITIRGREALQRCSAVFLDSYTSMLFSIDADEMQKVYGCAPIQRADRETVEVFADRMLEATKDGNDVAFLVVGDAFGATTHTDLYLRAVAAEIPVQVVSNASIINAVGVCGLQLYNYGQIVSIPFFTSTWKPCSFIDKILANWAMGLHTLCLLDIRVKERTDDNIARNLSAFEPPRFMTVVQALQQLLMAVDQKNAPIVDYDEDFNEILIVKSEEERVSISGSTIVVAMLRIGCADQKIVSGTIDELLAAANATREVQYDLEQSQVGVEIFGAPLHSLIIPGPNLHGIERDMLAHFSLLGSILRS